MPKKKKPKASAESDEMHDASTATVTRSETATQPLPPPPRLNTVSKRAYKKARKEFLAESTKSPQPGTFPFTFSVADWLATPGGKRTYDSVHRTATHAAARLRKFTGNI